MAKSYLTPEELAAGNKWLKTVFFPSVRNGYTDYVDSYDAVYVSNACKEIYEFIVERKWDVSDSLRNTITVLSKIKYYNYPNSYADNYTLSVSALCKIFANVCAKKEIFWDESTHTNFELDYFKKTPFGAALWDFRCFVSQEPDTLKVSSPKTTTSTNTTKTSTPKATGTSTGAGHTLYRNNAGGIVGTSKEILSTAFVYCIIGEFVNPGKTKPRIHVSPQNQSAPLKVKYNSGQGHNDCILYFADRTTADIFKQNCEPHLPSNVVNLSIKKMSTDPNGYVEVDTEFGPAYIKASKLHEEIINEEVEDTVVTDVEQPVTELLPESHYREDYEKAAFALNELLY